MSKIFFKRTLISGVIIALFCCSFIFVAPVKSGSNTNNLVSTTVPGVSTSTGSSNPTGDEWSMFHGNLAHTGLTETTPIRGNQTTWNYTTGGAVESSPAIVRGRVYIGSNDGQIYCLNATTDAKLWNYTTGGAVQSSPAIADGMVFVGSEDGYLYCFNDTTGTFLWQQALGSSSVDSSPAISNGRIYIGGQSGYVYCINETIQHNIIWSYKTSDFVTSSPAIVNGLVYIGGVDGHLYCLNANTGAEIWNYTTSSEIISSPAVANGMVYVGDDNNILYCLNATYRESIWNFTTTGAIQSSPAVWNGMVYVGSGSGDGNLYCLNANTGAEIWNYTTGAGIYSSPAVSNGMVYVGSMDKNLYGFNALTGTLLGNFSTNASINLSSPAIAEGMVFVGSEDYNVYSFPFFNGPPSAPTSVFLNATDKQIFLSWNQPTITGGLPITLYNIYRGNTSTTEYFLASVNASITYFLDAKLVNGQTYYYKIEAVNSAGIGYEAAQYHAYPSTIPDVPVSCSAIPGNLQITLNWSAPVSNGGAAITQYRIFKGNTTDNITYFATVGNVYSYTDNSSNMVSSTSYYYQICAVNKNGNGPLSGILNGTTLAYNGTTPSSNNKSSIGGMNIGALLSVSLIGIMAVIVTVKKRINIR